MNLRKDIVLSRSHKNFELIGLRRADRAHAAFFVLLSRHLATQNEITKYKFRMDGICKHEKNLFLNDKNL